ncbi:23323_t:CDS:2 [Gigaspora rosea]|nr:23323_t:CDS:2 [Gigaspora rosea]
MLEPLCTFHFFLLSEKQMTDNTCSCYNFLNVVLRIIAIIVLILIAIRLYQIGYLLEDIVYTIHWKISDNLEHLYSNMNSKCTRSLPCYITTSSL